MGIAIAGKRITVGNRFRVHWAQAVKAATETPIMTDRRADAAIGRIGPGKRPY